MSDRIKINPLTKMRLRGYQTSPDALISDVQNELLQKPILQQGHLTLTPKYLLEFHPFHTVIIPLESVLWIYHLQDIKFRFREMRERMVFSLRIYTISGSIYTLRDYRKKDLDKILEVLTDRYPNFFYDYSEEHEKMVAYILNENKKELNAQKKRT